MPLPDDNVILKNTADINSASLLYEQNCKCGTIEILITNEEWVATDDADRVWKIVVLNSGSEEHQVKSPAFSMLAADNISAGNCTKLMDALYVDNTIIMGNFSHIAASAAEMVCLILYKDCSQS